MDILILQLNFRIENKLQYEFYRYVINILFYIKNESKSKFVVFKKEI